MSIILISGAMSHSHPDSEVIKINGNPLILYKELNITVPLCKSQQNEVEETIRREFINNDEKREAILNEFKTSMDKPRTNLTKTDIENYFYQNNKTPLVITYDGHYEKTILNRLQIFCNILYLNSFDKRNNGIFFLRLINSANKKVLTEINIGYYEKTGRTLSLNETHKAICNDDHNITYLHDPIADVKLTKCIYKYIIKNTLENK